MNSLAILARELRARARRGTTYWSRCAVAAFAAFLGVQFTVIYTRGAWAASVGANTFIALAWFAFALACVSVFLTADSISGERREGTLGLLFLTPLDGHDVLLGKLVASGLSASYALMGFVPVLALALLSGGITGGQVLRCALALLDVTFVFLAAGLWISVRARDQQRAMRNGLLSIVLLLGLPWLAVVASTPFNHGRPVTWLALLSPHRAFHLASRPAYRTAGVEFWLALALTNAEGWLLLLAGAYSLRRTWRGRHRQGLIEPESAAIRPAAAGAREVARRREALEQSPIGWLASRLRGHGLLLWCAAFLLLLGGFNVFPATWLLRWAGGPAFIGLWSGLSLAFSLGSGALLAWAAGRFLFEARRTGELELLLSTPLGGRDVVEGYWWAIWLRLRGALLLVGFLLFLEFLFSSSLMGRGAGLETFQQATVSVNKALDAVALCWVGMWFGLRARKPSLLVAWTVGLVIVLPWIASYGLVILLTLGGRFMPRAGGPPGTWGLWLVGFPILIAAKNIFFVRWAAGRLRAELRTVAPLAVGEWVK